VTNVSRPAFERRQSVQAPRQVDPASRAELSSRPHGRVADSIRRHPWGRAASVYDQVVMRLSVLKPFIAVGSPAVVTEEARDTGVGD
jgi:hypothetical protein